MHQPVLVSPPAILPVSLDEVKKYLRLDNDSEDALVTALIKGAAASVEHYYCALVEQIWSQAFDAFGPVIRLSRWPVIEIESVKYRNAAGQIATVDGDDYALRSDALGPYVRMKDAYTYPSSLYQSAAVTVEWAAGYPIKPATAPESSTVPDNIKAALLLIVGDLYKNREAKVENALQENQAVKWLLSPYRVWAV